MSPLVKLVISLVIAVIAYTLTSLLLTGTVQLTGGAFDLRLLFAFFFATAAAALIVRDAPVNSREMSYAGAEADDHNDMEYAGDTGRASGKVKWFNASKGFGFIVMDDGEEIFVHYRSIRGEGRRTLRDGQNVSFRVAQSDKGPQAEDVSPEGD